MDVYIDYMAINRWICMIYFKKIKILFSTVYFITLMKSLKQQRESRKHRLMIIIIIIPILSYLFMLNAKSTERVFQLRSLYPSHQHRGTMILTTNTHM